MDIDGSECKVLLLSMWRNHPEFVSDIEGAGFSPFEVWIWFLEISIGVHKLDIENPWCSWFLYYCALNARVSFLGFSIDFVGIEVLQWCSGFNVAIKDFQLCFGLNVNLWFCLFRFWSLICLLFSFYGFNLLIPFAIHLVFAFVRMMLILGTSDGVDV